MTAPLHPAGLPAVEISPAIDPADQGGVRAFYADSTVQPFAYEEGPSAYATLIAETIASFAPASVLEFGCGSGRNLDVLRRLHPARLVGVDINAVAIDWGRRNFGLDLYVGDEGWLATQPPDAFDIVYTVSVIDHIPLPATAIGAMASVASELIVIYEIMHPISGRVTRMEDHRGLLTDGYPFSYFHDYPSLFEKAGCWLVADAAFPADPTGLYPYYRLQIYTKRQDWPRHRLIRSIGLQRPEP
ncbi:MAG TPA: class I SAM-dependent methyltransferase [Stellaceae bacterium]|jgi:SAM-dependent methyltransferase